MSRTQKNSLVALLIASGAVIYIFESAIPRPLPWVKPGLANLVTLLALEVFGIKTAALVALGRVAVVSLVTGSFGNLGFAFSLSGAVLALLGMGLAKQWLCPPFGIAGIGLIGATGHALGQLGAAWFFLVRSPAVLILAPTLTLTAAITGLVVGLLAAVVLRSFGRIQTLTDLAGTAPADNVVGRTDTCAANQAGNGL